MRTKDEIMKDSAENQLWDTGECANSFRYAILEALLDIRDILKSQEVDLQDIAEPIKHLANNDGGNF